jgi:hypothetical protein
VELVRAKFSHYRWADAAHNSVAFIWGKDHLGNEYECDFGLASQRMIDLRARPGRLPPKDGKGGQCGILSAD